MSKLPDRKCPKCGILMYKKTEMNESCECLFEYYVCPKCNVSPPKRKCPHCGELLKCSKCRKDVR